MRRAAAPAVVVTALLWVLSDALPLLASTVRPLQPVPVAQQVAQSPGKATLAVMPAKLPLVPTHAATVMVQAGNDGGTALTNVKLTASAPRGVAVKITPEDMPDIPPGGSVTVNAVVTGDVRVDAGSILFTLTSDAGGIPGEAIASTELSLVTKLVEVAVSGSDKVTETNPAYLIVVVTNPTSAKLKVTLTAATSNPLQATFDGTGQLELEGNSSTAVRLTVETVKNGRLSKGRETVILTTLAEVIGSVAEPEATPIGAPQVQEGTTAHVLESAPFGEEIITGPLGVTSVLLVPGLAGLMVGFAFLRRHRFDRGLSAASWADTSKNVLALAGVVLLSIAVAGIYRLARKINLFEAYRLSDIGWATLGTVVVCLAIGVSALMIVRYVWPYVSSRSKEQEVLRKAARFEDSILRAVVTSDTDGGKKKGLVIASGFGSTAASPPITYQGLPNTDVGPLRRTNSLSEAQSYIKRHPGKIILKFADNEPDFISKPETAPFGLSSRQEKLLRWTDE